VEDAPVSRRTIVLLAAALLSLALAVLCALLARDVAGVERAFRNGDVAAADSGSRPPDWQPSPVLPADLAESLLAVEDDLAFRRAVALFRRAHRQIPGFDLGLEGTQLRVRAEAALARVIRSDHDPLRASAAANLLGVLALVDATANPTGSSTPIERSVFEFQQAIRLDPRDEQAKANLELVYELLAGPAILRDGGRQNGPRSGGASAIDQGRGY
jgi:hypothetical protein